MTQNESDNIDEVLVDWHKTKEAFFKKMQRRNNIKNALAFTFPLWIAFALFYIVGAKLAHYVLRETMGWD